MTDLPTKWTLTPLENCGEWGSGGTPTRTNPLYYQNGTIPWLIIGDLNDGIVTKAATHITEAGLRNSSAKLLPINTLLVAMYGSIGKLGITGIECATNQAIAYCKPHTDIALLKYLFYVLMNSKEALLAQGQGGAQQNINQGILKAHNIPLAPLNEQKRIAEKLETLLARADSCQRHLARVPQILKGFRQSILAAATSGRLTERWRVEQGLELSGWKETTVEQIAEVFLGRQRSPENHYGEYMRKYVRAANVTWDGWDFSDVKEMNFNPRDFEKYRLRVGDILLNEGSGSSNEVGKPAVWNGEIENCCFQNTLICVRPYGASSQYLYYLFLHTAMSRAFVKDTRGVNIFHIGKEKLASFEISLPSLAEQYEIVRRVETLLTLADRLEARWQSAKMHVAALTPSLLAKAFRGELVAQDAADESAEALLERIREARELASKEITQRKPVDKKERTKTEASMLKRKEIKEDHLSAILKERGALTAEALWSASQLKDIDEFYEQLKDEEAKKLLREVRGTDPNAPRLLEAL